MASSKNCGLKCKNASQNLEPDFPDTFVEQRPPATIVAIPDEGCPMKNKLSQSSSLEKILQANLEASNLKVRELQAELLGYESRTKELEAKLAHEQQLSKKLQARVQEFGLQLVQLMDEKNVLMAEKHARMIDDLNLIRGATNQHDEC